MREKAIAQYGFNKLPKKWRVYEEIRNFVIEAWSKQTLRDAWDMLQFSVDLLHSWENPKRIITKILQKIGG
jgi:hypothetical protein